MLLVDRCRCTGTTTTRFGELLAAAHRIALPGAAIAVFAGTLLLVIWYGAAS